jgi:hypothetical protein
MSCVAYFCLCECVFFVLLALKLIILNTFHAVTESMKTPKYFLTMLYFEEVRSKKYTLLFLVANSVCKLLVVMEIVQ